MLLLDFLNAFQSSVSVSLSLVNIFVKVNHIKHSKLSLSPFSFSKVQHIFTLLLFCLFDSLIIRRTTRIRIAKNLAEVNLKYFT